MSPRDRPRRRRRAADPLELRVQRRRRQRHKQRQHGGRKLAFVVVLLVLLTAIAGGVASLGGASEINKRCDLDNLRPVAIGQNTFVYAADGSFLGTIPAEKNRTPVELRTVSPYMRKAIVAIEDRRFYEHGGIDVAGILRAAWADVRAGKVVQGGSTITQQLVRNLYIGKEVTLERKVTEACLAIKLNSRWSKNHILQEYLNQVYFGNHAYGIEAAAQTYFSRRSRNLTLSQAALLAGLPQAPSVFDPFNKPDAGARAAEHGAAGDARQRRHHAGAVPGGDRRARPGPEEGRALQADPRAVLLQLRPRGAPARVRRQHRPLRRPARLHDDRQALPEAGTQGDDRHALLQERPAAAVVSIEPRTGAIRAMDAVIPGKKALQFNLAAQARRQAGSTFKTFVLAEAIEQGADPDSTYYTSAPFFYRPDPIGDCDTQLVVRRDLRRGLLRLDVGRSRRRCARTTPSSRS